MFVKEHPNLYGIKENYKPIMYVLLTAYKSKFKKFWDLIDYWRKQLNKITGFNSKPYHTFVLMGTKFGTVINYKKDKENREKSYFYRAQM